ncbi:MAG: hypothetical protein PVSMB2_32050 [Ktedonobacteraceae bacterium]
MLTSHNTTRQLEQSGTASNGTNKMGEGNMSDEGVSEKHQWKDDFDDHEYFYEGARKQIYVHAYERNRDARTRCIELYGASCIICGFGFEKIYGKIGENVIYVHHLKPLSDIGETYQVDPTNDLRPVCPNCHVIIHKRNPPYSINEVTKMIRSGKVE